MGPGTKGGVALYGRASLNAKSRSESSAKKLGLSTVDGGLNARNALKHCIQACDLCLNAGDRDAKVYGDDHETTDPSNYHDDKVDADTEDSSSWLDGKGAPKSPMAMDLHNNMAGRKCCGIVASTLSPCESLSKYDRCQLCCEGKAADCGNGLNGSLTWYSPAATFTAANH